MRVIEARGIRKRFHLPRAERRTIRERLLGASRPAGDDAIAALDGIDLTVVRGEALGVMGRNGSGKSTLLKVLCGIFPPDEGSVSVEEPVTALLELGLGWNPDLDAVDNALLAGTALGVPLAEMREAIPEILRFAELERFASLELRHYSSGMAARLAYAVAFQAPRPILVLDEIFAVGDAGFQARCRDRYDQLRRAGHTLLLVSHDPDTIAASCDRAVLVEAGRLICDGPAPDVARAYTRLLSEPARSRPLVEAPEPLISVLVPCRDLGAYLPEAIESVRAQTFSGWEILIVDDGSREPETRRVLDGYEKDGVRVLRRATPGGPAAARNAALREARGSFVCALDADDRLDPRFFELALARFEQRPGLGFVSCWLRTFGEEEWEWRPQRCDLDTLLAECTVATPALVRTSLVRGRGGFDEAPEIQSYEDWDLWLGLVASGVEGEILPEVLFHYRRRSGSLSAAARNPEVHRRLMEYLVAKYAATYAQRLPQAVEEAAERLWAVVRENQRLELDLATRLRPGIDRLLGELGATARLMASEAAPVPPAPEPSTAAASQELRRELDAAVQREQALRLSWSWKLTRPMRAVHAWLVRGGGRP
jgi:ABC-type polysaccharide/polyol phosphate transport system ATPase subunit/GT2 family glycosyltransferase